MKALRWQQPRAVAPGRIRNICSFLLHFLRLCLCVCVCVSPLQLYVYKIQLKPLATCEMYEIFAATQQHTRMYGRITSDNATHTNAQIHKGKNVLDTLYRDTFIFNFN